MFIYKLLFCHMFFNLSSCLFNLQGFFSTYFVLKVRSVCLSGTYWSVLVRESTLSMNKIYELIN